MNWIRKILKGIFTLILISLICLFVLSFYAEKLLVDGVIKVTVHQQINVNSYEEGNEVFQEFPINEITDDERIQELLNSEEVQELVSKYLEIIMDGLISGENIDEITLEEDIIEYIKENKGVLEELTGQEITDEMIEQASEELQEKEVNIYLKNSIRNTSENLTETEKEVLKGYQFFISTKFKIILFLLIILDIIIIALIQWSLIRWIKTFGKSLLVSGIGLFILEKGFGVVIAILTNTNALKIETLTKTSIIMMIAGLIIWISYKIIEKKVNKKRNDEDEISQDFEHEF